jgi:hypothetical protein
MSTLIADRLELLGIERRFALDVSSVKIGIRPRGLLHVPRSASYPLECLLGDLGLRVEASRILFRSADPLTRESLLTEESQGNLPEWSEVWFARRDAPQVSQETLFEDVGRFLGYPACCRAAMTTRDSLAGVYRRYLMERSNRQWQLNRLSTLFSSFVLMPDFFPCSLSCSAALNFVEPFLQAAKATFKAEEVSAATRFMKGILTIIEDQIICWPDWWTSDGSLHVDLSSAKKERVGKVCRGIEDNELSQPGLLVFEHLAGIDLGADECDVTIHDSGGPQTQARMVMM